MPGRAAASGGRTFWQLFNGAGSGVLIAVEAVTIDLFQTVLKAATVIPPVTRLYRTTTALTGGVALTKGPVDTALTSPAAVTLLQDGQADGTVAATQLGTTTLPGGATLLTQEFTPRLITLAGYEMADRMEFLGDSDAAPILREGQGIILRNDYPATASEPNTEQYISTVRWSEFTLP